MENQITILNVNLGNPVVSKKDDKGKEVKKVVPTWFLKVLVNGAKSTVRVTPKQFPIMLQKSHIIRNVTDVISERVLKSLMNGTIDVKLVATKAKVEVVYIRAGQEVRFTPQTDGFYIDDSEDSVLNATITQSEEYLQRVENAEQYATRKVGVQVAEEVFA
jgi:hypothetical protein